MISGQSVVFRETCERTISHPDKTGAGTADPDGAVNSSAKGGDVASFQFRRSGSIQSGETHAVKARQSLLRPDPQVPVLRLSDRPNRILRQPVVRLPHAHIVMREGIG